MTDETFKELWEEGPHGQQLCALVAGSMGWLMYLREPGDAGFSSRNPAYAGPADAVINYVLSNGQVDSYPASWAYPVDVVMQALDYFRAEGRPPPFISWHNDAGDGEPPAPRLVHLFKPALPLVELVRERFDDAPWRGFIVGESEELVLIHQVSDRYSLDGYRAFRRADVSSLEQSFARADLIHRALKIKQQSPAVPTPPVDLSSMRALMQSAQEAHGVLVISREDLRSDEVEVGAIRMNTSDTYVLRWLSVDAEWDNDDRPFRYRDVTMLEFGGEYEQTLLRVALAREEGG